MTATQHDTQSPRANGRILERGTEVSIRNQRGRFRFVGINKGDGSGCFYGGPLGHEMFRDFYLTQVRVVHAKKRTRANLAQIAKEVTR